MDLNNWTIVCSSGDITSAPSRHKVNGRDIVLVRDATSLILAMDNRCPHKAASLHRSGDIEDLGDELGLCLRCPKHKGKFGGGLMVSFKTGKCVTRSPCSRSKKVAEWSVQPFETKEVDNHVFIRIKPNKASGGATVSGPPQVTTMSSSLPASVESIRQISPDAYRILLALQRHEDHEIFAVPVATMWHIWLCVGDVSREYTPISSNMDTAKSGEIELLIKVYDDGSMSKKIRKLRVSDKVLVSAPRTTLHVQELDTGGGLRFNLLAGGTGIAPCLQLLRRAQAVGASASLLYSVWTTDDLLLSAELEELETIWSELHSQAKLSLTLILTRESFEMSSPKKLRRFSTASMVYGRQVDSKLVAELMHSARQDTFANMKDVTIISGPVGFNNHCESLVRSLCPHKGSHHIHVLDS